MCGPSLSLSDSVNAVSVSVSLSLGPSLCLSDSATLKLCLCVSCNSLRPGVSPRPRAHRTSALSARSVSACTLDVSASFLALQVRELHVEKTVVCRPVSLSEAWCLRVLRLVTTAHAFGNQRRAHTARRGEEHHLRAGWGCRNSDGGDRRLRKKEKTGMAVGRGKQCGRVEPVR